MQFNPIPRADVFVVSLHKQVLSWMCVQLRGDADGSLRWSRKDVEASNRLLHPSSESTLLLLLHLSAHTRYHDVSSVIHRDGS